MLKAKTAKVFMQDTIFFLSNTPISDLKKVKYAAKIGSIMYTILEMQINITFATSIVSRFVKNPSLEHFNVIDQIL